MEVRRNAFLIFIAMTLLFLGLSRAGNFVPQTNTLGQVIPGQYIVALKENAKLTGLTSSYGIKADRTYKYALNGFAAKLTQEQVNDLRQDADVKFIEQDRIISLDPMERARGFGLVGPMGEQPKQQLPTGVDRIDGELNKAANINGKDERVDVDVAVIDTGIQLTHPDLNVFKNATFVEGTKDGNDDHGHGTHCGGTIAALDNGIGVVGVAPGARLWAVKVLNKQGSGSLSGVVAGIDYVTKNADQIEVASMSLGGEFKSDAIDEAITKSVKAGVTYSVAAGNSKKDAKTFSPANHPDVICVSAIADFNGKGGGGAVATCRDDVDDSFADFSNFGNTVKIAAPGVCILSTWTNNDYKAISGTSMACPHVSGSCALIKANNPNFKPAEVKAFLLKMGKAQADKEFGFDGDPDESHEPMLYVGSF